MQNTKYWKISPWDWGNDPDGWKKQWRKCQKEKIIAIGWGTGDLSGLGLDEIKRRLLKSHQYYRSPRYTTRLTLDAQQLWNFRNAIKEGHIIVANKGQKEIVGIGRVIGQYFYDEHADFPHHFPVKWVDTESRLIETQKGWLSTVIPLTDQKVRELGILKAVKRGRIVKKYEDGIKQGATFSQREVETRNFQQAFRNTLLELYRNKCAVCDIDDDAFLRGCHIVPVSKDKKIAADPTNGICLCVLHDAAFENGIFSISDDYKVLVAEPFNPSSSVLVSAISKLNWKKIKLPVKHFPNKSYLKRHREFHGF